MFHLRKWLCENVTGHSWKWIGKHNQHFCVKCHSVDHDDHFGIRK